MASRVPAVRQLHPLCGKLQLQGKQLLQGLAAGQTSSRHGQGSKGGAHSRCLGPRLLPHILVGSR